MDGVLKFVVEKMPMGVVVFDSGRQVRSVNRMAELFLRRYGMPEEVDTVVGRIFDAMDKALLKALFPGEVRVEKRIDGSPSQWSFKFSISEGTEPVVIVFITERKVSDAVDVNSIRRQFRLTRRETDVLRCVLDGLKNTEIAETLEIGEQTVKDHLSKIYSKVDVDNRFGLARRLLDPGEDVSPDSVTEDQEGSAKN